MRITVKGPRAVGMRKMFHAGKHGLHGVGKHENYGGGIENPVHSIGWALVSVHHGTFMMNGDPNIGQLKPFSILTCEHCVSVALPRSSPVFLSYAMSQSNTVSQDKGVAGAKLAVLYWSY